MKKFLLPVAAALLASCGLVPLPAVTLPEYTLTLPSSLGFEQSVLYDGSDAFGGKSLPGLLSNVKVTGNVSYSGAGNLSEVGVYLRSSLPACDAVPGTSVRACDASGETAQKVGTLTLQNGVATGFTLSGAALDTAAKAGHGYFGVQAMSGSSVLGDTVKLSGMQASARF